MAVNGLSSFLHAPLTNESSLTYGESEKTGGAIEAKVAVNYNEATIYSDNKLKHKDTSFKDGTITLTVDYANKAVLSPLLGRTTTEGSFTPDGAETAVTYKKYKSNSNDKPIPVGFGYIVKDFDIDGNKDVYTVKFFYKIEFKPYAQDAKTKEGTIAYTYATLEGTIFELENGDWCEETDFSNSNDAIDYLKSLFEA